MMTSATHVIFLMVLQCLHFGTPIATYDIHLGDLYKMQNGIGWPHSLNVFVGHEALLKLTSNLDNLEACEVTTPEGREFNIRQPPSNRFEIWDEGCNIKVKNVGPLDNGRWRLTAVRGNESITGWTEVHVEENIDHYNGDPIILHDGQTHTTVDLTTLSNSYCLVAQPFSESSLVPGHCSVLLDRTTRAVQGNWHVLLGLPGRVSELQVDRSVAVESERLDVGFLQETNPNKLHLYCHMEHTAKNITFCRFQKTNERAGYNVIDGLSDGTHSYYGEGFSKRQCGMTIEYPTAADYGTWRCTLGVQEWVGTVIEQRTPLQALIRVVNTATTSHRINRTFRDNDEERVVFVQQNMTFTITCQAEASLNYCWFQHPNGSQYTPTEKTSEDQLFWFTNVVENLQIGMCGITFKTATANESGIWTCHMGPRDEVGFEDTDKLDLRVTPGPLAATESAVVAYIGYNATLNCHTTNGFRPLDYCRFLTPHFVGISVDPTITQENALFGRFYFTPGRDLIYGDCSLTISPVLEEDMGEWTCAALVDEEVHESRDMIQVTTEGLSRAGVVGMSIGASALVLTLVGVLAYKYRTKISTTVPWRRTNNTDRSDRDIIDRSDNGSMEMHSIGGRISLESGSSGSSGTVSTLVESTRSHNNPGQP